MSVQIKGQGFVGFLNVLRQLYGDSMHRDVLDLLPPDLRTALNNGEVLAMGWYPIDWYANLHDATRTVCGDGAARHIGREATRSDVQNIYRFILKFLSPETLLDQSGRVFGLFCQGGVCTVEAAQKNLARIYYASCPGANRGMWETVLGGTETLVELCGGHDVVARPLTGGNDGDSLLLAQVTWKR